MNLSINFTDEEINKTRADDQKQAELKNFLRLTECWEIAEKIGFIDYRRLIKQYLP